MHTSRRSSLFRTMQQALAAVAVTLLAMPAAFTACFNV